MQVVLLRKLGVRGVVLGMGSCKGGTMVVDGYKGIMLAIIVDRLGIVVAVVVGPMGIVGASTTL